MKKYLEKTDNLFRELSREISLFVGLIAVAGSLATSEIFGWQTFTLSTYQRVLMYPLVPIIGAGIALDREDLRKFVLPFSIIGMFVSLYHFVVVRFDPTQGCGFALPCSTAYRYTLAGFSIRPMYLPLLAFIAFVIITFLAYWYEPK
jgi:disulfide bond formation protein DsbB